MNQYDQYDYEDEREERRKDRSTAYRDAIKERRFGNKDRGRKWNKRQRGKRTMA